MEFTEITSMNMLISGFLGLLGGLLGSITLAWFQSQFKEKEIQLEKKLDLNIAIVNKLVTPEMLGKLYSSDERMEIARKLIEKVSEEV
jgi:hypothetical protein